ncbi:phage tail sheath family protein [Porphyromonas endodontalis]|uniref:phage tail sheath family protein n=1 Tax=Porphyromonas endodontalis TaxID=28124 RepID=UPI00248EDD95|nr:phage tail sheath C-terminal domain-containing protein [Porphyromonas endodontalis]
MASYKTPGVYVEEIPKLPQSVADVPTAIPGFVGYTEFASSNSDISVPDLQNKPKKIGSLLEFERFFGKAPQLTLSSNGEPNNQFVTYDSIRLFYDNGGGVCYIVSIGDYNSKNITSEKFTKGLKKLEDIDEVTLLVMPDAATCLDASQLASVQVAALLQCKTLKDRFAILDVKEDFSKENADDQIQAFRDGIKTEGLEYGAAYYPYISTAYTYNGFDFSSILGLIMKEKYKTSDTQKLFEQLFKNDISSCLTAYRALRDSQQIQKYINGKTNKQLRPCYSPANIDYETVKNIWNSGEPVKEFGIKLEGKDKEKICGEKYESLKSANSEELKAYILSQLPPSVGDEGLDDTRKKEIAAPFLQKKVIEDLVGEQINKDDSLYLSQNLLKINPTDKDQQVKEEALKPFIPFYEEYEKALAGKASIVPPSGAIAGIYAQNDNFTGVWKAPANMGIASVKGVSRMINNQVQEGMNVHSTGKSVNAIRAFSGKGILVWGARTLKGNDNEWRYIPVRRLFNYVEESVQESTEWAVFSPNNQNTWTKIKCQIENFLTNIWRAGGLAGATPDQAFYVNCGLNVTMDAQDILEGRLIVEIGMAAVRPAEFIILRFSHKLQES